MSIWTITTRVLNADSETPVTFTQTGSIEQHPALMSMALDSLTGDGFRIVTMSADGLMVGLLRQTAQGPDIATVIVTK